MIAVTAVSIGAPAGRTIEPEDYVFYAGTYANGGGKGIYAFRFNPSTGKTVGLGLAAESISPSFLVVHPDRKMLYAVNEAAVSDEGYGAVSAFAIDAKAATLKLLNQTSSGGSGPCHLTTDRYGRWLLVANYGSGSVSVFPILEDGRLGDASTRVRHSGSGKNGRRQEGPHAHSVVLSPDDRFLMVPDLGLDKVMIYRFDVGKGTLAANDPPFVRLSAGSGPRHISFHPNGRYAYLINELGSTVTAFAYDADRGSLREFETISTLPQGFSGENAAAEIEVHRDGKFVYGSNRGHDSITAFAIRGDKSILEPVEYVPVRGKTPRHFTVDPTGNYLFAANQHSGEIIVFRIDRATGRLTAQESSPKVPSPVCVVFVPSRN